MASNKTLVPEAKAALDQFKMEAASEVGVNLKQGYNGELTSRQAGSIGGQMVKKMVENYYNDIKASKNPLLRTINTNKHAGHPAFFFGEKYYYFSRSG